MDEIRERIVYIAGASSRARTTKAYIEYLYPKTVIGAFLVSPEMDDNDGSIDGVPVIPINNNSVRNVGLNVSYPVFVATRGVNREKIQQELQELGFMNILPVDVFLDSYLRNEYMSKKYKELGKDFQMIDELSPGGARYGAIIGRIYVANSINDKALVDEYILDATEEMLQVGAKNADARIPGIINMDDDGRDTKNISGLNSQFCELTGLYWIWKNTRADYVGLVHYRRHFVIPDNWINLCDANNIDVVLPVPLYVAPNLEMDYKTRHVSSDLDVLFDYFKSNIPSEYEKIKEFFQGNLYSPCNMLIARRDILNELCEWLFTIIFAVYRKIGDRQDTYQRRYPGFMSERLISYFFEEKDKTMKVVYANKNFLN